MVVTTIVYRRLHNLGDYNNESFEVTAEVDHDEDVEEACRELKDLVDRRIMRLYGTTTVNADDEVPFD